MSDRLLKESDVMRIAFQLPYVVNSAFADAVKALPSADRPQGKWIEDPINKNIMYCSNCKVSYNKYFLRGMSLYHEPKDTPDFCPKCGAKMKGANIGIDCFDTCKHAYSEICNECYKGNKYDAVERSRR